jgi:hypothetical protein
MFSELKKTHAIPVPIKQEYTKEQETEINGI